ncbi:MAG TPA: hypothetical protein VNA32_04630 [Actinomycetota bacterium]|nr:hypothetical protein [Actinomycetota bacterium]
MIKHLRSRVVEVEAIQVRDVFLLANTDWASLPWWIKEAYMDGTLFLTHNYIGITDQETRLMDEALMDDWILRSSTGYIRPASQSEIEHLYEVV